MCAFNTKITIAQLLSLTIVSAKSKIYSPRRGYLSPGNSIGLGNSSYFIIHQRHNFLLISGLILLERKHASNRSVYFRDLCVAYSALSQKSSRITFQHTYANLLRPKITQHDKFTKGGISQKSFPAKILLKKTTFLLLEAKNLSYFNRGFARQPCCMAGTMKMFCIRKNIYSHRKKNLLFLPCNMAAVQNLYRPYSR